jgi:hypothetical protein
MNGIDNPQVVDTTAQLRIVPFVPGRRPSAEAIAPGLGSSDGLDVRAPLSFTGPDGSMSPVPVPGWEDRAVPPLTFVLDDDGAASLAEGVAGRRVLTVAPAVDLRERRRRPVHVRPPVQPARARRAAGA